MVYVLFKDYTLLRFESCDETIIMVEDDDWTIYQRGKPDTVKNREHIANVKISEVISIGFTEPNVLTGWRK